MLDCNLTITDQDRADAAQAIELLTQDLVMRILKNQTVSDFQNTMSNLIKGAECTMKDAGLMAFLPSLAGQIRARQQRDEEIAGLSQISEYLGKNGEKIKFSLTVMTSRWSDQFNCWSVNGKDDRGNLISFFTSKQDCTQNGVYTAKIKRTEQSRYHNGAKVTTVNFVKSL